jgi:glycosyltransferase involved in cell wall biosynthesis
MDDDLLDLKVLSSIPLPYAFRLWRKVTSKRKWILSSCSELWVSTPYLAKKYAAWHPRLIRPVVSGPLLERNWLSSQDCVSKPYFQRSVVHSSSLSTTLTSLVKTTSSPTSGVVRICYHGTWSHRDDMKWFAPIICEVQRLCSEVHFDVIGDARVARIFKKVPRITVLDTMPWPDYLSYTQNNRFDIGVAPLLDTLFNRGRGPIKFFDYARCGAVGVYSSGPAFESFVTDGVDGFVLKNDQQLWIDTLVKLVRSPELRASMYEAAWQKVLANSTESPEIQAYLEDLREHIKSLE